MARLRVGMIGCGWFAQAVHLPLLKRLSEAKLTAIAEPDASRRDEVRRYVSPVRIYADYRDMLKAADVEAVNVAVPTPSHAEIAIAAMESGRHVYLEKPIASSLDEAERILKVWKEAGVVGMVGFNYRFNDLYRAARLQLQAGKLGPLTGVRSMFSTPARPLPSWKQARVTGGGALLDLASHHIDLIRFLFGKEIRNVYAGIQSHRTEEDTAMVHFRLADGLEVQSFFSLCAQDEDRFEIYGQAASLTVDRYRSLGLEIFSTNRTPSRFGRLASELSSFRHISYLVEKLRSPWDEPSYREALLAFISAVQGKCKASPDLEDGCRSAHVIAAAEDSAKQGRPAEVPLDNVDPSRLDGQTVQCVESQ